jgi:Arc/MetJ-type ribon-helix-helix transcriptional regulator
MQVQLKRPELEQFIAEQVEAGHFSSAEDAIEAAVEEMMLARREGAVLSDEDAAAINEADAEIDRGEFVDFDTFAAEARKKYCDR